MKYLKLFESFDDNKEVVISLKKIHQCIETGAAITSELNAGDLVELHDKCEDPEVKEFLLGAVGIAEQELGGEKVVVGQFMDSDQLLGLITKLEANPVRSTPGMKIESYSLFMLENHNMGVKISGIEMNLFSSEPVLGELITNGKITLKDREVLFDGDDAETREILDQYLEMLGE